MKKIKKVKLTYSNLVYTLHRIGYSLNEIDDMDIGFMRDMILEEYKNQTQKIKQNKKQKQTVRWATQEDFDRL